MASALSGLQALAEKSMVSLIGQGDSKLGVVTELCQSVVNDETFHAPANACIMLNGAVQELKAIANVILDIATGGGESVDYKRIDELMEAKAGSRRVIRNALQLSPSYKSRELELQRLRQAESSMGPAVQDAMATLKKDDVSVAEVAVILQSLPSMAGQFAWRCPPSVIISKLYLLHVPPI